MKIIKQAALAVAGIAALAIPALAIPSADASTVNCAVSNGCGTLHGTDAIGHQIALDAKRQANLGMDIGYPDLPGDRATTFSLVPHAGRGHDLRAWTDSSVSVTTTIPGLTATVTNGVLTFSLASPVAGYVYTVGLGYLPGVASSVVLGGPGPLTGSAVFPMDLRSGDTQVSVSLSAVAGTNPAPTPPSIPPVPASGTITFHAQAHEVFTPSQGVTSYTIVYVTAAGDWTSDCVTAVGAGMLRNEPCTLGRDQSQQFEFLANGSPAVVPDSASVQAYAVKNIVTGKFLEDQSTAVPTVPQSDAADSVIGSGRQLDVNGPSASLWTFGS